ncbi:MAG TPA: hypothetical protein VKV73_27595 [Chloroflexota bacterium]|nr:hypothetical protein [Chloroflexota bacterium]
MAQCGPGPGAGGDRELADQAEANHDAGLAQPNVGDAHALQGNRPDRDERGVVEADQPALTVTLLEPVEDLLIDARITR